MVRASLLFILVGMLVWVGCTWNNSLGTSTAADKNVDHLARIAVGMTQQEVLEIMRKPFSSKTIQISDDRYEIWFYVTRMTIMDQDRMMHTNLTPITFKNGLFVGRGYLPYKSVLKQQALQLQASETGQEGQGEDTNLEKTLNTPTKPESKPASKQKPQAPTAQPGSKKGSKSPSNQGMKQTGPEQPAAPVQPQKAPQSSKKGSSKPSVTMSKAPKAPPADPEETESASKKTVPLTEEDQQMLDEEQEQNFNFW